MIRQIRHLNEPGDFWLREDCDWCHGHKCLEHHGPAAPLPAGGRKLLSKRLHIAFHLDTSCGIGSLRQGKRLFVRGGPTHRNSRRRVHCTPRTVLGVAGRQLGSRLSLSIAVGYLRVCSNR